MKPKWILAILFLCLSASAQDMRSRLKGLVYEAEDWTTPKGAWVKDEHPPDKWCLWTTEEDVLQKRSGGQSLQSPPVKADRERPEDGAPPLHTHITGIPEGFYQVWMSNPNRNVALSFDGEKWTKISPSGEINLGIRNIADGTFDLWVDDRYASPGHIGSCYYDYIRFEQVRRPEFSHITAFTLPDGNTQISWITDAPVPTGSVAYGTEGDLSRRVSSEMQGMRNHAVVLRGLEKGKRYTAQICIGWGDDSTSPKIEFMAGERPTPPKSKPQKIPLSVAEPTPFARTSWPVTSGVPFKRGELASAGDVRLVNARGEDVPAQFEALSWWPDGSVRWLLADFQADTQPNSVPEYVLDVSPDRAPSATSPAIATDNGNELALDTGALSLRINKEAFVLFDRVAVDKNGDRRFTDDEIVTGEAMIGNGRIVDAEGKPYGLGKPDLVSIETNGPLRATLRIEGDFAAEDGAKLFRYRARITCYANSRLVRLQWTIGNNKTDQDITPLTSAGILIPIRKAGDVVGYLSDGNPVPITSSDDLWIFQDYDNRFFKCIRGTRTEGERDIGLACVGSGDASISAMVRDFWQTCPKSIAVKPDGIHLRLLPPLPADQFTSESDRGAVPQTSLYYCYKDGKYLVKRGLEYTSDVLIRFDQGSLPPVEQTARHFQEMIWASAKPEYYCATGAFWRIDPRKPDEFPEYAAAFDESFRNLEKNRQAQREYGWMNYGDWWGERRWNWGNSEYDLQYVMALHFAQTGNLDLFWRGDQMARHNTTIDVVHYPWVENLRELVYAHSVGHVGGFFERNDPRITNEKWGMSGFIGGARDSSGGHTFQGGNFLYGFLTGDRRYLEVAEEACWNQAATYTPRWGFRIERACGWSLYNAISAYESTLNPYYLNAARIYIEKVFELQDPETGGWRMPQGAPECDCGVKHIGGKAFAAGVLLHGLIMYDLVCPDDRVKHSIVRGADWLLDYSWNENKLGFRYKTGCPKYKDDGWYTTLVTEGIAYAYELTKNERYKEFLLRTLPLVLSKQTGGGRGAGKSFASHFRHLPHTLFYVKRWGVTSLPLPPPPPPPPKMGARRRVFINENGRGVIRIVVYNEGKEAEPCELKVVACPQGCSAEPESVKWQAAAGPSVSPDIAVDARNTEAGGLLKLAWAMGRNFRQEFEISIVAEPKPSPPGDRIAFVGPDDHYSNKALREMGGKLEGIADLRKADLSQYRTIVVGSDVLGDEGLGFAESALPLAGFVKGGGRLVLLQINDEHWRMDFFPFDLEVQDLNDRAGEITDKSSPLFADVPSISGTVCYDTIAFAGPEWKCLAADSEGRPCILLANYDKGEILVIEPSFDRWASAEHPQAGTSDEVCRNIVKNLVEYCARRVR